MEGPTLMARGLWSWGEHGERTTEELVGERFVEAAASPGIRDSGSRLGSSRQGAPGTVPVSACREGWVRGGRPGQGRESK